MKTKVAMIALVGVMSALSWSSGWAEGVTAEEYAKEASALSDLVEAAEPYLDSCMIEMRVYGAEAREKDGCMTFARLAPKVKAALTAFGKTHQDFGESRFMAHPELEQVATTALSRLQSYSRKLSTVTTVMGAVYNQ